MASAYGAAVEHDLGGVLGEFRRLGFAEAHRLGGHGMHQRASLAKGEYGEVDFAGQFLDGEDEAASAVP